MCSMERHWSSSSSLWWRFLEISAYQDRPANTPLGQTQSIGGLSNIFIFNYETYKESIKGAGRRSEGQHVADIWFLVISLQKPKLTLSHPLQFSSVLCISFNTKIVLDSQHELNAKSKQQSQASFSPPASEELNRIVHTTNRQDCNRNNNNVMWQHLLLTY